jgi:Caspase domain
MPSGLLVLITPHVADVPDERRNIAVSDADIAILSAGFTAGCGPAQSTFLDAPTDEGWPSWAGYQVVSPWHGEWHRDTSSVVRVHCSAWTHMLSDIGQEGVGDLAMTGLPDTERSQAVLIGVGHYQLLPDLKRVHYNLPALALSLQDKYIWGLSHRNCAVVEDPVHVADIVDPLIRAANTATDTLVVYYAGHAFVDPSHGELYLALTGSDPQQVHTAVPYEQVLKFLRVSQAASKVLILDCIYSGVDLGETIGAAGALAARADTAGTYLLASASVSPTLPLAHEPYTPFTGELLRIMQHGIIRGGSLLDLNAINAAMRYALVARGFLGPLVSYPSALGQRTLIRNQGFGQLWSESPSLASPVAPAPMSGPIASRPLSRPESDEPPYRPSEDQTRPGFNAPESGRRRRHERTLSPRPDAAPPRPATGPRPRRREREPADDWVRNAVQAAVQRGLLVFNPPEEMRQGHKDRVEVGIARSASLRESLLDRLHGRGQPQFEEIETSSLMSVELKGDAFQITSYSVLEQIVEPLARWEFDVMPIRAGLQTLTLCVCLRVALPRVAELGGAQLSVPVLERDIRIRINVPYGTRRFLVGNWQWLVGTAVGLGGCLAAWIALVH